jgi:hypothetical protein
MEKTVQDIFVASAALLLIVGTLIYLGVIG